MKNKFIIDKKYDLSSAVYIGEDGKRTINDVKASIINGSRTVDDIMTDLNIPTDDEKSREKVLRVLNNICNCRQVSLDSIMESIKKGNKTVEDIAKDTGATTVCGRCKSTITHILEYME